MIRGISFPLFAPREARAEIPTTVIPLSLKKLRPRDAVVETQEIQGLFEDLTVFVSLMHIPSSPPGCGVAKSPPVPLYKGEALDSYDSPLFCKEGQGRFTLRMLRFF